MENGLKIPPIAYADDHLHTVNIQNPQHIEELLQVYRDYEKVSGLKISHAKTVIMGINTDEALLEQIHTRTGIKVVEGFRYLGLEIRKTYANSKDSSYEQVFDQMKRKYNRIHMAYLDLFHKRQLINSVVLPSFNHIFMVFGHDRDWADRIDREIILLLWTQKQGGVVKQKRRLVAKKRLSASHEYGGLKIFFSKQIAYGLILNLLKRCQQNSGEDGLLITKIIEREIFREMGVSLHEMLNLAGAQIWSALASKTGSNTFIGQLSLAMSEFLKLQESNNSTWLAMPILGHSLSNPILRLNITEGIELARLGFTYVAQIFGRNELTGKVDKKVDAEMPQVRQSIRNKCMTLRFRLSKLALNIDNIPGECILKTLNRVRWSAAFRIMYRDNLDCSMPGPPSYFSRIRDGIPVPELKKFMGGYKQIFKLHLFSKTLETSFLTLNRQIWTNLKQHLSNGGDQVDGTANCSLCDIVENTGHLLFECEGYSFKIWCTLQEGLRFIERHGTRPTVHGYNVLYNLDILGLSPQNNEQILYLIQEIKRDIIYRRYIRSTANVRIRVYTRSRIIAHLLLILKKTIYQKTLEGSNFAYLVELQQHFSDQI
jgi:hypothetical protein